jgi:uncharacterized membrane protein
MMSSSPQFDAPPPPPAQAGLSDNAAGAIAYLTVIPAIVFLLVEPYNRSSYVRFHAWQCIFLTIASVVVHTIFGLIPIIGWFLLLPLAAVGFLVVWIIVLLKALKGVRYHLPFIGKYAEQQAGV